MWLCVRPCGRVLAVFVAVFVAVAAGAHGRQRAPAAGAASPAAPSPPPRSRSALSQQGQIEVDSETVFKLAALVLQVSGTPRLSLPRRFSLPCIFFFFFPVPYGQAPAGLLMVSGLEHIGVK